MEIVKFTKGQGVVCDSFAIANELFKLAWSNGYDVYDPLGTPKISYRGFYWDGMKFTRCAPACVTQKIPKQEFLQYISRYDKGDEVQISTYGHPVYSIGTVVKIVSKVTDNVYGCKEDVASSIHAVGIKDMRLHSNNNMRARTFNVPVSPMIAKPLDPSFKLTPPIGVKNFFTLDEAKANKIRLMPPTAAEVKDFLHPDKNRTWKITAEQILNNGTYGALGSKEPLEDFLESIRNNENLTKSEKQFMLEKTKKYSKLTPKPMIKSTIDMHVIPADLLRRLYGCGSAELRKALTDNVHPFTGEVLTIALQGIIKLSRGYGFKAEFDKLFPTLKDNGIVINPVLIGTDVFKSTDGEFLLTTLRSGKNKDMGFRLNGKLNWSIVTDEEGRLCLVPKYK